MATISLEQEWRTEQRQDAAAQLPNWSACWKRWALALVVLGVAWRTVRFALHFPIWGDEAFVCLNVLDRGYLELIQPLRFFQVAPLLFLWGERTVHLLLGDSEMALRFLPFLCGLGALALFWRLARLTLSPLARVLAIGILAVSYFPVRHSCEVKPYAGDLLMSLALLVPAVSWLRQPQRVGWLGLLVMVVPVALGSSYPSVFVAGAVSLALLAPVLKRPGWAARGLYLAYNLAMVGGFLGFHWLAGLGQYQSTGNRMGDYWSEWFPPHQPLALLKWLASVHTGNLLAYPVGGPGGASALSFLLFLVGVWHFGWRRQWDLFILCLAPFALTLLAATLHRYPYGGSARIMQHLAPIICLVCGAGAAEGIVRLARHAGSQKRWALAACGLLFLVGAGGIARDLLRPYKTDADRRVRQIVTDVAERAGGGDQIVAALEPNSEVAPTFQWYLRRYGHRISWSGRIEWERLTPGTGQLWCLRFGKDQQTARLLEANLAAAQRPLLLADHVEYHLALGPTPDMVEPCEVLHWTCLPEEARSGGE